MSGIGKYEEIAYEAVIAETKSMCNLENTSDYDQFLEVQIDEAMRSINDLTTYEKKTCTLQIIDGRAQLPKDFIRLYGARFLSNGNCQTIPYIEREFISSCGCEAYPVWGSGGGGYEITAGTIVFHEPISEGYDEVNIGYLAKRTDEQGRALMLLRHARAAKAYAASRFYQKMAPAQDTPYKGRLFLDMSRQYKFEYAQQKAHLIGKAHEENFEENKRQISRAFNAWIIRWNKRTP